MVAPVDIHTASSMNLATATVPRGGVGTCAAFQWFDEQNACRWRGTRAVRRTASSPALSTQSDRYPAADT